MAVRPDLRAGYSWWKLDWPSGQTDKADIHIEFPGPSLGFELRF